MSKHRREKTVEWFKSTLMSRLNNKKGVIILVTQRLHPDDLSGYVIEKGWPSWVHINLPAIATENEEVRMFNKTYYFRQKGQALHSDKDDVETLHHLAHTIGTFAFEAQYQ